MTNISNNAVSDKVANRQRVAEEQGNVKAVLGLLGKKVIPIHPALNRIIGNMNATVLLSQLLYWQGRGGREDGWIYKTRDEFSNELGITLNEYDSARKLLREYGLIEEGQVSGMVRTLHFRPNLDAIEKMIQDHLETPEWHEPLSKRCDKRKANRIEPRTKENRNKARSGGNNRVTAACKSETIQLRPWKKSKMHFGNNPTSTSGEIRDGNGPVSLEVAAETADFNAPIEYKHRVRQRIQCRDEVFQTYQK